MKTFGALVACLFLLSCGAIKQYAKDTATEVAREVLVEVKEAAREAIAESQRLADANADGTTTPEEWSAWLVGGTATLAGLMFEYLRRRLKSKIGELWKTITPIAEAEIVRSAKDKAA